jgi:hypothetical protein
MSEHPDGSPEPVETHDGFTLDELCDYLDEDRTPTNPAIEASAACVEVLERLAALRSASWAILEADVVEHRDTDPHWIETVLASVRTTAHAGRDIPVPDPDPAATLLVTEGAVRAVVRRAGDAVDGVVVRRVRLRGDVRTVGVPIDVDVTASVALDRGIRAAADELHAVTATTLARHAPFPVATLTVHVVDVHQRSGGAL